MANKFVYKKESIIDQIEVNTSQIRVQLIQIFECNDNSYIKLK